MKFLKWFLKTNPFHLAVLLIGYIIMFSWGEEGISDRRIVFPFWTLVLIVLIIGKYIYWKKSVKDVK